MLDLIKSKKVLLHLFEISCYSVSMEAQGQLEGVYSPSTVRVPKTKTQMLKCGPKHPNLINHPAGPVGFWFLVFFLPQKAVKTTREIRLGNVTDIKRKSKNRTKLMMIATRDSRLVSYHK